MQSWREFSLAIADLFLTSEDSGEWVKEPRVRRIWHITLVFTFAAIFYACILSQSLTSILENSAFFTLLHRSVRLGFDVGLLCLDAVLVTAYYRHLLTTGRDLRFRNIPIFWGTWVVIFTILYIDVYNLNPKLFSYLTAPYVTGKTLQNHGLMAGIKMELQFLLYSACTTVNVSVPGLTSASPLVSALNLIETLGSFLAGSLLVATFVSKSNPKKTKA
jgi:hypothetical protein